MLLWFDLFWALRYFLRREYTIFAHKLINDPIYIFVDTRGLLSIVQLICIYRQNMLQIKTKKM